MGTLCSDEGSDSADSSVIETSTKDVSCDRAVVDSSASDDLLESDCANLPEHFAWDGSS